MARLSFLCRVLGKRFSLLQCLFLLFCPGCAAPIMNTHTQRALTGWENNSLVVRLWGVREGVARRQQPGNSPDRWVGSRAGDRGHTCCLPGAFTQTHTRTQAHIPNLLRSSTGTSSLLSLDWMHTCSLDFTSFAALFWKRVLKQTAP